MGMFMAMSKDVVALSTNFADYFLNNIVFVPLPFILAFIITRLMKPEREINDKAFFAEQLEALGPMSVGDKKVLGVLLALMLYLFTAQWHGRNMLGAFCWRRWFCTCPVLTSAAASISTRSISPCCFSSWPA